MLPYPCDWLGSEANEDRAAGRSYTTTAQEGEPEEKPDWQQATVVALSLRLARERLELSKIVI